MNSRTVSGTTAETFGFDTLGRMNSHVTQLGTFTYGYLGNSGQVASRTIGSVVTSWGYDTNTNDRRLLTIGTTGAVARNFTYTANVYQITAITDTPAATHPWLGQNWSFSYDGSDRLLTGNGTIAGNRSFSYDKLDNATSFAGATASYNNLNQITAWNAATHTYDNNGNLTGDGTRTYTYDAADRLKTVTQGGTTTTFAYDGLGRRLKQTVGSTETRYLWCGAAICQQRSNTDVVQKRFFAEGEYVLTGTKKYLSLTDHLGSVRDLIDITGTPTLVGSFDYTPYGAVARSWGTVTPGYTYAGLFAHTSTGLLLSATRAYDPAKGRFLNRDMIPDWGYGYGFASPMMFNDPLGLAPNPLELTCIYPGQPVCWAGVAIDVATNLWMIYRVGRFIQATMPPIAVHSDAAGQKQDVNCPGGSWQGAADEVTGLRPSDGGRSSAPKDPEKRKPAKTLRKMWENSEGKPWPKDPNDPNRNQDVSHTMPVADDGAPNNIHNIEPKPHAEHMQEHIDNGDFARWAKWR